MEQKESENIYMRSSTVGDVINDPYFEDFGRLLFPIGRSVSEDMTLEEISSGSVYVWYNYIDPDKTVEIIFFMIFIQRKKKRLIRQRKTQDCFSFGEIQVKSRYQRWHCKLENHAVQTTES